VLMVIDDGPVDLAVSDDSGPEREKARK